ncbi:MAG: glycosyltransferase family 9 protein [Pseudomonadota bacterium]
MRLLIVKLSSIGDVTQALCVLEPLRALCSHLGWIVEAGSLELIDGHPLIDRVHLFPKQRLKEGLKRGPWGLATCGLMRELRGLREDLGRERYDTVLDMQGLFKSALVVGLCPARRKVGFEATREFSHLVLTERLPQGRPERHAVLKYLDLVRGLGAGVERVTFPVAVRPDERRRVEDLAAGAEGRLITVCPRTRWETKLWPAERFAALVRVLVRRLGAGVALAGALADHDGLEVMRREAGEEGILNLAGRLNLREFAHLSRISRLVVSCDSGPMHLAAAVGTPVVALFGPTAPWRTGPFGGGHRVVRKELACSPCFRRTCASRACMLELGEAEVLEAVEAFWRR